MCFYNRLSGEQHGFRDISLADARKGAEELSAVLEVPNYIDWKGSPYLFSVSFYNKNGGEVALWHRDLEAMQVFDPPRRVAIRYLTGGKPIGEHHEKNTLLRSGTAV